ncbi:hypothetical protein GPA34_12280 [Listeria monocytogenes]|uniref:hypothetical protein n=1 Tax=Listeria monocytogenes TaxID=1639 RepID=UPI00077B25EB|nr:hypothetical protein [Listeria monocytogenes]EAC2379267.1 hypothetical protein [Listeria monocytogenes]EAD9262724.1 hypothetical protein [Listeria monocytogenes]EAE1596974.1 hypothetical protein [Listeria monocytogenes]EAE1602414.1 hypothetical protein [Listeria monocytogenes]EAG2063991.1 hypothetical protein [Listeria monocytogenes]
MAVFLDRWGNVLFDTNKEKAFNDNMTKIENGFLQQTIDVSDTNRRIDNLVLNAGGDSPNEVVDARTSLNGQIYNTLESRLNGDSSVIANSLANANERLEAVEKSNAEIERTLQELYGNATQNLVIYVSKTRGSDDVGTGAFDNPYQTIQKASNSIPKIVSGIDIEILCEPANYDEDVIIEGIYGAEQVYLRSSNHAVVDAKLQDTGFYIRSVTFSSVAAQCVLEGMTQSTSLPEKESIINFLRVDYASVGNCRFDKNLKSTDKITVSYNQTRGGTFGNCYISNQNVMLKATYNSTCNFSLSNQMSSISNTGLYAQRSIIYSDYEAADIVATTKAVTDAGGQIF